MSIKTWLHKNTESLDGKTVALFGASGGIGQELARYILSLGGELLLIDRNLEKQRNLREKLAREYPDGKVSGLICDLEDIDSVRSATEVLKALPIEILIHNAGAYSIPRRICKTGLDNVYQINFASPYYITRELLPLLEEREGRVIAVGSIAHNYSKTDPDDIDFRTCKKASLAYGNAKRYLMFSLLELSKEHPNVHFCVAHPGITFTNITAHYPKLIFAVIKHPMKVIFMKPKKAALSILSGMFEDTLPYEWIGPRVFDVWGKPSKKTLKTCKQDEIARIYKTAEKIYSDIK